MSGAIVFRNRQFGLTPANVRACADTDEIAAAFYAGLSTTFPDGERFFVQSVKAHSDFIGPELAGAVAAFVKQEGAHAREHMAFNDQLAASGYPMARILARAAHHLGICQSKPALHRLAVTIALEHFTAIFARRLLADPRHLAFCDAPTRALWHWHAVEEIEHKAVAYDVFNAAATDLSGLRRWALRAAVMSEVLLRLAIVVFGNVGDILKSEGKATFGWQMRLISFLMIKPGVVGQMLVDIADFFRPGFHPDAHSDAPLLDQFRPGLETPAAA